ncbi:ribonuclease H, partial [Trifolium pratense]
AVNLIIAGVSLSGNNCKLHANSNITEFTILRAFHVKFKYANAPVIKEVLWQPPVFNWIKCNCDGSSIGISSSLHDELIGAMTAVEIAHSKGWINLWIETDSMLVVLAFKSSKVVPWTLRNRWDNCLYLLSSMLGGLFLPSQIREDFARNRENENLVKGLVQRCTDWTEPAGCSYKVNNA